MCKKCGKELQYRIDHVYANDPSKKDTPSSSREQFGWESGWPMGRIMTHSCWCSGKSRLARNRFFPRFGRMAKQRSAWWAVPPLLSLAEWKRLFRRLDASFNQKEERIRLRAYELYEHRGKRDGHALG